MKTLFLASSLTALAMAAPAIADDWGYSGEHGPDHWGGVCTTGMEQSPIDIANAIPSEVSVPTADWSGAMSAGLVNNGHTLQVNFSGDGHMHLGDTQYNLLQLHFHSPSEHTVTGESFPLEVHFVHASEDGALAVIGVFFEEGEANAALTPIWAAAPGEAGEVEYDMDVDFGAMMPSGSTAYRYAGSLTTPPCSEVVAWTVMDQPVTASAEQIETFVSLFGNNARPTLPVNRRYVLTTD